MRKKFFYQMVLFFVLISFSFVNVAGAHLINLLDPSQLNDNGTSQSLVKKESDGKKSDEERVILARSDKSKKSKKSKKSRKSEKSRKSDKSKKSKKSKKERKRLEKEERKKEKEARKERRRKEREGN